MSTCGGSILFDRVMVEDTRATQVLSALESRTKVTIQAARDNTVPIYLLHSASQPILTGWKMIPGDVLTIEDRGTRAAVYARSQNTGDQPVIFLMVEGA